MFKESIVGILCTTVRGDLAIRQHAIGDLCGVVDMPNSKERYILIFCLVFDKTLFPELSMSVISKPEKDFRE